MSRTAQYLLVIYLAERRASGPIASGTVAESLDSSPAATTEMLQRLEERGLVTHVPYEGARLTAEGRARAGTLFEAYTTLSVFFEEVLGLDDHESEAMRLAGTVSPVVTERLEATLLPDGDTPSGREGSGPSFRSTE